MAGIDQFELTILADDEITAKLGGVIAVRVVHFLARKEDFGIEPKRSGMVGAPEGGLKPIGFVDFPFTVEENGEMVAVIAHPFLNGGKCPEGDDDDARVAFFEFFLVLAQLCHMLAAGNSAQMPQKDE